MGRGLFIVAVLALVTIQCFGIPSSFFSQSDKASAVKAVLSHQNSDGTFTGLKNTYFAVATLNELKAEVPKKDKICASVQGKQTDAESIFYSVYILETLGCGVSGLSADYQTTIENALKSSSKVSDLTYALSAYNLLEKNKHSQIKEDSVKNGVKALIGKADDDGQIGNVFFTGLALQALSSHTKQDKDSISAILTNAVGLASQADGENTLEFDKEDPHSSVRVTSSYFKGIVTLANALDKKAALKPEQTIKFAETFIQRKFVSGLEEAFAVVEGLTAAKSAVPSPLVVSLQQSSLSAAAKGAEAFIKTKVTDIFGDFASKAKVVLAKATGSDKSVLVSDKEFSSVDDSTHQFDFLAAKPEQGTYNLELKVSPTDEKYITAKSIIHTLKLISEGSVADATVTISDSTDAKDLAAGKTIKPEFPKTETSKLTAENFQHITVAFKVKNAVGKVVQPHQAFLSVSNGNTDIAVPATFDGKQYSASVSVEDIAAAFGGASGDYSLTLFIGDSFLATSFNWKVATVSLKFPHAEKRSAFAPKPEIVHQFRPAEKRPPAVISTAFTFAVLAPFLFLFVGLIRVGANISNFPFNTGFVWAVGFQACLGSILALFALYWISLTMVQTLIYLAILSVPTVFFAQKALNHVAAQNKIKTA